MPHKTITSIIDFFYPPFKKLMPLQTFRYAACGGGNTLLGLLLYGFLLRFVFTSEVVNLGFYAFKSFNVAMFITSCINFIVGFLLMKFVVFVDSNLRGRIQLFRYLLTFGVNICLNYLLLNFFVQVCGLDHYLGQCISIALVITISYISQKHFTFKVKQDAA